MTEPTLKPGDVVRKRGRRGWLTVERVGTVYALCIWWSKNDERYCCDNFKIEELVKRKTA